MISKVKKKIVIKILHENDHKDENKKLKKKKQQ